MSDVYFHFDSTNRPIYIGMTTRGFERQEEHALTKSWWQEVARIECVHLEDRQTAREFEELMIRVFRPRWNIQHNGGEIEWDEDWEALHDELALSEAEGSPLQPRDIHLLETLRKRKEAVRQARGHPAARRLAALRTWRAKLDASGTDWKNPGT